MSAVGYALLARIRSAMFETHNKRGREIIGHLSYLLLSEDTLAATHRVREAGPGGAPKPRLLDRVRETVRARHYSRRTEKAYVHWIRRYIFFHGKRHPAEMGAAEVTSFLTSLAVRDKVAASTQNQALSALLFLYREVLGVELPWLDDVVRAKRPQHLPVVLTRDEVRAVLQRLDGVPRPNQILIRDGKGHKDRVTMLPASVKSVLSAHIERVREQHQADVRHGAGWVELPGALTRKYPNAGRDWGWQWIFPATRLYMDGLTGQRRRHHLHESVLQRAVRMRSAVPGLPSRPRATPSVTRLPPTRSRRVTTSGPSRSCSATRMSAPR